jgi:hypothetical protein
LPSVQIVLLTAATLWAIGYAFICQLRTERAARSIKKWVVQNRPGLWEQLPWVYSTLVAPQVGLRLLRRQGLQEDENFLRLWESVIRWRRRSAGGLIR